MTEGLESHNTVTGPAVHGSVVQAGRIDSVTLSHPNTPSLAMAGLPPQPVFVGRDTELARLLEMTQPGSGAAVVVSALSGLAGVGKTALAIHAAQHMIDSGMFPGGVFFIDLQGYDESRRVDATRALGSLLRALGVPATQIPVMQDDRERMYRSILARSRPVLIVADNASSAGQVRPLIPGHGKHRLLITSRHTLSDVDGARLFDLDALGPDEAVALLNAILCMARPDDMRLDDRAAELARLCGYLPLALRIASALLVSEPERPLAEFIDDLGNSANRLEQLQTGDSLAVRAAFDLSYTHLPPALARVFRLQSLNPGADVSTEAIAAVVELPVISVRRMMAELRRAHLVRPVSESGRWGMHDLVRLYARERADLDEAEADRLLACDRLLDFYVEMSTESALQIDRRPWMQKDSSRFDTNADALAWLDAEWENLVQATVLANDIGRYGHVRSFELNLWYFAEIRRHLNDILTVYTLSLEAGKRLADDHLYIRSLNNLGIVHLALDEWHTAIDYLEQAITVSRSAGSRKVEGVALGNLGRAYVSIGRKEDALRCASEGVRIHRAAGDRQREVMTMCVLGEALEENGDFEAARQCYTDGITIAQEIGDRHHEAQHRHKLGKVLADRPHDALRLQEAAVRIFTDLSNGYLAGLAAERAGSICSKLGSPDAAREYLEQACRLLSEYSNPEAVTTVRRAHDILSRLPAAPSA